MTPPRPVVEVGPVRPDEHDRVGDIVLAAYDRVGAVADGYRTELRDTAARDGEGSLVLVARVGGEPAGTVTVVAGDSTHFEHDGHGDGGMRALAVAPGSQGRGVGSALVDAALDHARDAGWRRLVLTSMTWMHDAHRLYQRRGFVRRPDLDVRFSSGIGLAFQLDLDPVAATVLPAPGPVPADPPRYDRIPTDRVSC